jgi:hypothetical protein
VIELQLSCNEQKADCISFQLRVTNCSETRLLLPFPEIIGLTFADSKTGKRAEWYTSTLESSSWAGMTLPPTEHRDIVFRVRPCSVPRPQREDTRSGDYRRWCVELHPGVYAVDYLFRVGQDYFDGDSHWNFSDIQLEATKQSATAWLGVAQSNILNIQVASQL